MGASAGLFDAASTQRVANSSFSLYSFIILFNKLILLIIPAIMGNSIYRDFKSRSYQIMYTFPFTKWDYLTAKFLSSLVMVLIIAAVTVWGLYFGTQLPGTNQELLAESGLATYLQLYASYLPPNVFLFGSLVFLIVVLSRNIYAGFIAIALLLIGRELVSKLVGDSGTTLAALLEPLGETATLLTTKNWTLNEQNKNSLPFAEIILFNRLLWFVMACVALAFAYLNFSFSQNGWSLSIFQANSSRKTKSNFGSLIKIKLSAVSFNFNWVHQLRLVWKLSQIDFNYILRSGSFISIALVGGIFIVALLTQMNPPYETRILPVTWVMLAFPIFFFSLLVNFLTFLYAGILIHRGRNTRMNELLDVSPVSDVAFALSKLLALVKMQLVLLAIIFLSGIAVQVYSGYYKFDFGHYLFDLLAIHLIGFIIWAMAAVCVQTVVSNSYVGLFILILGFFGVSQLQLIGLDSYAFQFNQDIEPEFFLKYSDMNGHGHSLISYFVLKGYWLVFGILLFIATVIVWSRGTSTLLRARIIMASHKVRGKSGLALAIIFVIVMAAGFTVNRMENVFHAPNEATQNQISQSADGKYGHLNYLTQPRIVKVVVNMDLFPEKETFESTGVFTLINKSNKYIDTLLINYSQDAFTEYKLDADYETLSKDAIAKFDVNRLKQPLAPRDSLHLYFKVSSISNTWLYQNSPVLTNGSFITSLIFPGIGYYSSAKRNNSNDSFARQNHYRSIDSDYISFRATVSTSADQTAIAPGYLTKKWKVGDRNYFQYASTTNVTNDYVFTSGRYQVLRDQYKNINLEIYYHPTHAYNLPHLMDGLKSTMAYCEKYFSPYQHEQMRIIEYSRKAGDFAQSFANTIPVSERSFVMDIDDNNSQALNLSFLGASHELAHQWWGHQVIPADVSGSRMITESMAEYVSLCVLEEKYGKEKGKLFRRKALDIYLKRRVEDENEKSLIENSGLDKSYIPYQKGSLALYSMRDFLGEEKLNQALRSYLEKVKFQQAPYTIPEEMVGYLRQATPDSLKYLIYDLFETVTLYDNRLKGYTFAKLPNGKYQVTVNFTITKFRSVNGKKVFTDTKGKTLTDKDGQTEVNSLPLNDYVEIGIYSTKGEELHLKKHLINQISNKLTIEVDEVPGFVAIDPLVKLLDVHTDD
jgi:ABC-2 type transport system permease protein